MKKRDGAKPLNESRARESPQIAMLQFDGILRNSLII